MRVTLPRGFFSGIAKVATIAGGLLAFTSEAQAAKFDDAKGTFQPEAGDTLSAVAKQANEKYGFTLAWKDIKAANPKIKGDVIRLDREYVLPGLKEKTAEVAAAEAAAKPVAAATPAPDASATATLTPTAAKEDPKMCVVNVPCDTLPADAEKVPAPVVEKPAVETPAAPVETARPVARPAMASGTYTVAKGDSVCKIADHFDILASDLFKQNPNAFGKSIHDLHATTDGKPTVLNMDGLKTVKDGTECDVAAPAKPAHVAKAGTAATHDAPAQSSVSLAPIQGGRFAKFCAANLATSSLIPLSEAMNKACGCDDQRYAFTINGKRIFLTGAAQCEKEGSDHVVSHPVVTPPDPDDGDDGDDDDNDDDCDNDDHDGDGHDGDNHDGDNHDGDNHDGDNHDGDGHDKPEKQATLIVPAPHFA